VGPGIPTLTPCRCSFFRPDNANTFFGTTHHHYGSHRCHHHHLPATHCLHTHATHHHTHTATPARTHTHPAPLLLPVGWVVVSARAATTRLTLVCRHHTYTPSPHDHTHIPTTHHHTHQVLGPGFYHRQFYHTARTQFTWVPTTCTLLPCPCPPSCHIQPASQPTWGAQSAHTTPLHTHTGSGQRRLNTRTPVAFHLYCALLRPLFSPLLPHTCLGSCHLGLHLHLPTLPPLLFFSRTWISVCTLCTPQPHTHLLPCPQSPPHRTHTCPHGSNKGVKRRRRPPQRNVISAGGVKIKRRRRIMAMT